MPEPSIPFVILMGVGVVFIGLICIILLSMAMSAICRSMGGAPVPAPAVPSPAPAVPAPGAAIPNRQAMIAACNEAGIYDLVIEKSGGTYAQDFFDAAGFTY